MLPSLLALALAAPVHGHIPLQGALTDADGAPVAGTHTVTVQIYRQPAGTPLPLWDDAVVAHFEDGRFSAGLGEGAPLDLTLFDDAPTFLTVAVDGGAPSAPVPVGYAPRAAYAVDAGQLGGLPASAYLADGDLLAWSRLDPSTIPELGRSYDAGVGLTLTGTTFAAVGYTAGEGLTLTGTTFASVGAYTVGDGLALSGQAISLVPSELAALLDGLIDLTTASLPFSAEGGVDLGAPASTVCDEANRGVVRYLAGSFEGCTPTGWRTLGAALQPVGAPANPAVLDRSQANGGGQGTHTTGGWDFAGPLNAAVAVGGAGSAPTGNATRFFQSGQRRRFAVTTQYDGTRNGSNLFDGEAINDINVYWRTADALGDATAQVAEFWNPNPMWINALTVRTMPDAAYYWRHARLERWNGAAWELVQAYGPGGTPALSITLGGATDADKRSRSWRLVVQDGVNNQNGNTDVAHIAEIAPMTITEWTEALPTGPAGTVVDRSTPQGGGEGSNAAGTWDFLGGTGTKNEGDAGTVPTSNNVRAFTSGATRRFSVSSQFDVRNGSNLFDGSDLVTVDVNTYWRSSTASSDATREVVEFWNPKKMWITAVTLNNTTVNPDYRWAHAALERWNGTAWVEVDEWGPYGPPTQAITLGTPEDYANRSNSWRIVAQDGLHNSNYTTDTTHFNEIRPMMISEWND